MNTNENNVSKFSRYVTCITTCTVLIMIIGFTSCSDLQPSLSVNEQPNSPESPNYYEVVEEMPELLGGISALQEKIEYPERARRAGIEGSVIIRFIVNEEGDVEEPEVLRGLGANTEEEVIRVLSESKFRPGYQQGQPVRTQMTIPVQFSLDETNNNLTN